MITNSITKKSDCLFSEIESMLCRKLALFGKDQSIFAVSKDGKYVAVLFKFINEMEIFSILENKLYRKLLIQKDCKQIDRLIFSSHSDYIIFGEKKCNRVIIQDLNCKTPLTIAQVKNQPHILETDIYNKLYVGSDSSLNFNYPIIEVFNLINGKKLSTLRLDLFFQADYIRFQPMIKDILFICANRNQFFLLHSQTGKILKLLETSPLHQYYNGSIINIKNLFSVSLNTKPQHKDHSLKIFWISRWKQIRKIKMEQNIQYWKITKFVTNDIILLVIPKYGNTKEVHCSNAIVLDNNKLNSYSSPLFSNHYTLVDYNNSEYKVIKFKEIK